MFEKWQRDRIGVAQMGFPGGGATDVDTAHSKTNASAHPCPCPCLATHGAPCAPAPSVQLRQETYTVPLLDNRRLCRPVPPVSAASSGGCEASATSQVGVRAGPLPPCRSRGRSLWSSTWPPWSRTPSYGYLVTASPRWAERCGRRAAHDTAEASPRARRRQRLARCAWPCGIAP